MGAALTRAGTAAVEPIYAAVAAGRNWLFDRGLRPSRPLPRPVISVGNITTGGTGKTPLVRWLAARLRDEGRHVAVLARGYGARPGELGDEQLMLEQLLNERPGAGHVTVGANPDRFAAARRILLGRPEINVFVLDDGFQHRRLARDLDVVLVSATSPFGYGRVLPRGMLREPLGGLRRAGAVVITRSDQVGPEALDTIERRIREIAPGAPVYRATHAQTGLRCAGDAVERPLDELTGGRWFAMCGIGDPHTFLRQLQTLGGHCAGHRWFADHHRYTEADLAGVRDAARAAGADVIVTTEKDWVKLKSLPGAASEDPPLRRVDVRVHFAGDGERLLWAQVHAALTAREGN